MNDKAFDRLRQDGENKLSIWRLYLFKFCTRQFIIVIFLFFTALHTIGRTVIVEPWFFLHRTGLGVQNIHQARTFNDNGYSCAIVCSKNSFTQQLCKQHDLTCYFFKKELSERNSALPVSAIKREIELLYKDYPFDVLITPRYEDCAQLVTLAKDKKFKLICARHASFEQDKKVDMRLLKGVDAFVGGNPDITAYVKRENERLQLGIRCCATVTPFWDQDACLFFKPIMQKKEYFDQCNVDVGDSCIISTIAHFNDPCKNQILLCKALAILRHWHCPVHVFFAGQGHLQNQCIKSAQELGVGSYVHFLGAMNDVRGLLYYSDMHVLPSYYESFSVANLEAACLKKPIIMAQGISAAHFVDNYVSGLLFSNNDAYDLAQKIFYMMHHKDACAFLGQKAYERVMQYYCNQVLYDQFKQVIDEISQ